MISATVLCLTLIPFVAAQTNSTAFQIEGIQAHFTGASIVPSLLATFDPNSLLTVNFDGVGNISPGQALTQAQVAPTPNVTVTAANSSVELSGNYTITMVDAGPVGTDESGSTSQTRHWLVNGVTISNSEISNASATAITEYAGPAPPSGTGPHRYVILLYVQPSTFVSPSNFHPDMGVSTFNLNNYIQDSKLGPLVAGTYFTVEAGTATASISATSAVVSSTLPPIISTQASGSSSSGSAKPSDSSKPNSVSTMAVPLTLVITAFLALSLTL